MPTPNKIKYSTTPTAGTIKADNFLIGINGSTNYGPTSVTGFYQSLTPVTSGYTIHQNKATLGPSTFRPNNDTEFINLTKALGGNVTGVTDSLVYLNSQSDIVVINRDYEDMLTSGLTVCLSPSYVPSYPKSGSTFYNLANISSPLTFTMNNGVGFSSDGGGSLVFDGADDEVVSNLVYTATSGMSWDVWIKRTSDGNVFNMIMSNSIPYLAFRGTGSGGSTNQFQIAYRSVTGGTSEQRNLYTTTTYQNNTWYNITFTLFYDLPNLTSTAKIYVNGVLNTSVSHYSDGIYQVSSGNRLRIGNYTSNQYPFPGYIGRFLVYGRELGNNEIIQNYQSYLPIIINENIVTNGLVSYLDAGYTTSYPTTGTTWFDVSGYGQNGTLTNGPTYSSTNGGSLVFDGVDDYISNIGSTNTFSFIQNTAIFTIDVWVKPNLLGTAMYFMGNNDGTTGSKGFYLGKLANDRLWLSITRGVSGQNVLSFQPVNFFTNTNWVNITITCNGTTATAYKNGTQFTTTTSISTLSTGDSTRNLNVGRINSFATSLWNGEIAVSRIYNRSLSSTEVLQNFNSQKSRYGL